MSSSSASERAATPISARDATRKACDVGSSSTCTATTIAVGHATVESRRSRADFYAVGTDPDVSRVTSGHHHCHDGPPGTPRRGPRSGRPTTETAMRGPSGDGTPRADIPWPKPAICKKCATGDASCDRSLAAKRSASTGGRHRGLRARQRGHRTRDLAGPTPCPRRRGQWWCLCEVGEPGDPTRLVSGVGAAIRLGALRLTGSAQPVLPPGALDVLMRRGRSQWDVRSTRTSAVRARLRRPAG